MSVPRKDPSRVSNSNHSQLYHDLIETHSFLEILRAEQPRLSKDFKVWCEHRKVTIDTVDRLQKKIDAVFVGCNVAKSVGAAAGIVGGAAWLLGTVLELKGYKSAAQVIRTSQYCTGASAATIASSNLLEFGLTRSSMKEIEGIIKKDIELTQPLKELIQYSHKVETLFYQMFQCDIISTTFINIMAACGFIFEELDAGHVVIEDIIRDFPSCKMADMEDTMFEAFQTILHFLRRVQTNPRLLTPMKAICKIFEETPEIFVFSKFAADIYWKGYQMINSGPLSVILSVSSVGCCSDNCSGFTGCALNAAAIASNVVTFILAVKNIQEGKSKSSESLENIKIALKSELEEVTKKMNNRFLHGK